jgi:hypothetical protein
VRGGLVICLARVNAGSRRCCTCSASCMTACSSHTDSMWVCIGILESRLGCKGSQWAQITAWSIYVNICKGQHAPVVPSTLMAQVGGLCWAGKCTCELHAKAAMPTQELTGLARPTDQALPQPAVPCPAATPPTCPRRAHPCYYCRRARQDLRQRRKKGQRQTRWLCCSPCHVLVLKADLPATQAGRSATSVLAGDLSHPEQVIASDCLWLALEKASLPMLRTPGP